MDILGFRHCLVKLADSQLPQALQRLDDALYLVGAFLVFAAVVLGELFGGGGGGGAEVAANLGDLIQQAIRPGEGEEGLIDD